MPLPTFNVFILPLGKLLEAGGKAKFPTPMSVASAKLSQPENAWLPILVAELGIVILFNLVQLMNAFSPIALTVQGRVILPKLVQLENA